jgi:lysozyme family protein
MADFLTAYRKLSAIEGGYANHPNDRGKETWKGISRANFPQWKGWLTIDALRREPGFPKNLRNNPGLETSVQEFYEKEFWKKIYGEKINHQAVADEMFDTAVNMGVGIAISFAQNAINYLNKNGKLYADIAEDREMGPATLLHINNCEEIPVLVKLLNLLQGARYIMIMEKNPCQEEWIRGWLTRT